MQGGQKHSRNLEFNKIISNVDIDDMECTDQTSFVFLRSKVEV